MKKLTSLFAAFVVAFAGLFLLIATASKVSATDNITAYFIWNNNGDIAQHKFTDLQGMKTATSGEQYAYLNMIKSSDVVDDTDATIGINLSSYLTETGKWDESNYAWVPQDTINELTTRGYTTWAQWQGLIDELKAENPGEDEWDLEHHYFYEPMGAKNGKNSLNTNANREFRASIYDTAKYQAIKFGVSEADYYYFPSSWDPVFIESTVDLSGTTKANPAKYETYLLEPNLYLSEDSVNSVADIVSVKALDVNPDAVTITQTGNNYTIKFNSNYYNEVTFEFTDTAGKTYYLKVNRITGRFADGREVSTTKLKVGYFLSYDSAKSYNDYEVKALLTYANGSTKTVAATPTAFRDYDNASGDWVTKVEWDGGKNLKSAWFAVEVTKDVVNLDFTVTHKNAIQIADTYGGTFTGSGKGLHYPDTDLNRAINGFYSEV